MNFVGIASCGLGGGSEAGPDRRQRVGQFAFACRRHRARHSIHTSDARRPVGASRRWLNRSRSSTVQRGSTSMALTPKLVNCLAIPARRSSPGVPPGGHGAAAWQGGLHLGGHRLGNFVVAPADRRAEQHRDVLGVRAEQPASPPAPAPRRRSARRRVPRAPPPPPRRARRPLIRARNRRLPPPKPNAAVVVTNPSVLSIGAPVAFGGPSTTTTRSPCTWFIQTTRSSPSPIAAVSRFRFAATAAGSSPT